MSEPVVHVVDVRLVGVDDQTMDAQLRLTAELLERREGMGDRAEAPREVDHFAFFRRNSAAQAAARELESQGYRTTCRRRLLSVELAAHHVTAVDQQAAERFTRDVFDVIANHGGTYDGWGAALVK